MDKLNNSYNRGFDLVNDDFRFIDTAIRSAINDICSGFSAAGAILYGCEVTIAGTLATVTEGAIFFAGEVWHVDNHTFPVLDPLPEVPWWIFTSENDPSGIKLDKDLVQHNAYELRRAKGASTGAGTGVVNAVQMDGILRLKDAFLDITKPLLLVFKTYPNTTIQGSLKVHRNNSNVFITGNIQFQSLHDPVEICTVPVGFRSAILVTGYTMATLISNGSLIQVGWRIELDGKLYVFVVPGQPQLAGETYSFNASINIIYPL